MGLVSYYLASKAHDRLGDLEEWIRYNLEYIDNLNDRINKLEKEVTELRKIIQQSRPIQEY